MTDDLLLKIEGMGFAYAPGKPVLRDINLHVRSREIVCLLGASGSGKTTLIRIVQKLLRPSSGSVTVGNGATETEIAVVSQAYTLFPHLTAQQNVELVLRRRQNLWERIRKNRDIQERAFVYLAQVHMGALASKYPYELSGGQRQRVALAQALSQQTSLILMDEPLGALDEQIREELQSLLLQLQRLHGLSILFITHDLREALYLGQRLYLLRSDGDGCATIEQYPMAGETQDTPEIKLSDSFAKQEVALRNHLFYKGAGNITSERGTGALNRGIIDEITLSQIERQSNQIWVITPDLYQDVSNPTITEAVANNLAQGKKYLYFTPDNDDSVRQMIERYKQKFSVFSGNYRFYSLPADDPIFLFGEVVFFDPDGDAPYGFTYLLNGRGMMVALPVEFIRGYFERLKRLVAQNHD